MKLILSNVVFVVFSRSRMKKTLSLKSEVNEAVEMIEVRDSEAKRMTPYHCFHLTV